MGADATVLPPAQQGDVLRLLGDQPDVIAIVDGLFFRVPSLLHREILFALARGVRVMGAASLGALRAAELDQYGMEGVGLIYHWYRDGVVDADDEVAVLHAGADEGYRPLSVALVNLRYNLDRAVAHGVISRRHAASALALARRLYFADRADAAILAGVADSARRDALRSFLAMHAVDLKREDALGLLRVIARRIAGDEPWPARPAFQFHKTSHFELFRRQYLSHEIAGFRVNESEALALYRIVSPAAPDMHRRVAIRCLSVDEARARGIIADPADILLARYRLSAGLTEPERFQAWLRRRRLSEEELTASLRDQQLEAGVWAAYRALDPVCADAEAFHRRLLADVARRTGLSESALTRPLMMHDGLSWEAPAVRELKLAGLFDAAVILAGRMFAASAATDQGPGGARASLVGDADVEAWIAARWGVETMDLRAAVLDRGFARYASFLPMARAVVSHVHLEGANGASDLADWDAGLIEGLAADAVDAPTASAEPVS